MLVGMWMSRDLVTVGPQESVTRAAHLMARRRIRHLPVVDTVDSQERLVGIVSATEVFHAVPLDVNPFVGADSEPPQDDAGPRMCDIMMADPPVTTTDAPIEKAAALMHDRKISALPVIRNDALVGLITESDILRAFTQLFAGNCAATRITFDVSDGEDVVPLLAALADRHDLQLISLMTLRVDERCFCIVRVAGIAIDPMLEDLWRSKHRIESVIRS